MSVNPLDDLEVQLLLLCARTNTTPYWASRVRKLTRNQIDWPRLLRLAGQHGLRPLVHRSLKSICPDTVPSDVADQFHEAFRHNISCSLYLTAELHRVMEVFEHGDVRAMVFKGPALGEWAYGDAALRESHDLDVIVHEDDLLSARDLLSANGYHDSSQSSSELSSTEMSSSWRYNIFVHEDSNVIIDLQRSLEAHHFSYPLNDPGLWARSIRRRFGERMVSSFHHEDLLILLCVHGTKDVWPLLKWVCDIRELIHISGDVDWVRLLDRAKELRARRKLLLGVLLAQQLLGASLPQRVLREAQECRSLAASVEELINELFADERDMTTTKRVAFYFRTDDNGVEKAKRCSQYLRLCFRIATTPSETDRKILPLPKGLSFVYYLTRPVRLLVRYAFRPRRLVRDLGDWLG